MSDKSRKPQASPTLEEVFTPHPAAEIAFWSKLAAGYGRILINWHCGTGELAIGLAKRGFHVVGIDPTQEAIEIAQAREAVWVKETGCEPLLTWLNRDPRLVSLPGPGDFALLSGETLGHYLNDDQRAVLIHNLHHHLRPGGALGMSVPMVPRLGAIHNKHISGPMRPLPRGIFARRVSTLRYDKDTALLTSQNDVLVRLPEGEQRFQEAYTRRLYTPDEIFALLRAADFISVGMWGGWDRRPLRQAVGSFIVRAERRVIRPVGKKPDTKEPEPTQGEV